jgi:hypothetical protein
VFIWLKTLWIWTDSDWKSKFKLLKYGKVSHKNKWNPFVGGLDIYLLIFITESSSSFCLLKYSVTASFATIANVIYCQWNKIFCCSRQFITCVFRNQMGSMTDTFHVKQIRHTFLKSRIYGILYLQTSHLRHRMLIR